MTTVYYVDVTNLWTNDQFDDALSHLEHHIQLKITSKKDFLDRKMGLASQLMQKWAASDEPISIAPRGRPYVENGKSNFNVSHLDGLVAVGIREDGQVGVDLASMNQYQDPEFLESVLTGEELEFVSRDRSLAPVYWSIKEAYLKAGGMGLESFEQLQSIYVRLKGKDLYEVNVADKLHAKATTFAIGDMVLAAVTIGNECQVKLERLPKDVLMPKY
jgi:phosphopantetheinyl transferase